MFHYFIFMTPTEVKMTEGMLVGVGGAGTQGCRQRIARKLGSCYEVVRIFMLSSRDGRKVLTLLVPVTRARAD